MSKILKLSAVFMLFMLASCTNEEYDLGNVDMTMRVGGDRLALPLGADTIKVKSLMSDMGVDLIKRLDDGSYAFSLEDNLNFASKLPNFKELIKINPESIPKVAVRIPALYPLSVSSPMPTGYPVRSSSKNLTHNFEQIIPIIIDFTGAEDIESLGRVEIENAQFNIDFDLNLRGINTVIDMTVEFPEAFIFNKVGQEKKWTGNTYKVKGTYSNGMYVMDPPLQLSALNLTGQVFGSSAKFKDNITLKCSLEVNVQGVSLDIFTNPINFDINTTIGNISPLSATGKVKFGVEDLTQSLILEGLPEFLKKDIVLDLADPHLSLELSSNAGLPVNAHLKIVPYAGGAIVPDATQTLSIKLPKSSDSDITKINKYWVAKDEKSLPSGHTFLHSPNLANMFNTIPDSIVVTMNGELDPTQTHIIDFNANYVAGAIYTLEVPFIFGSKFKVSIGDTIADIPDAFSEILNAGGMELFGEIENSLPLRLELEMVALDEDKKEIKLTTSANVINSCTNIGKPVTSTIQVNLKREDGLKSKITTLIMKFHATAPDTENIPINDDDFLVAKLKVRIPNGILINDNEDKD